MGTKIQLTVGSLRDKTNRIPHVDIILYKSKNICKKTE
jgi:hypothetical protein